MFSLLPLSPSLFLPVLPPQGRAQSCKEDGNEYFKERQYKKAVAAYTAGIKEKCGDSTLTAILYTNRAAAQFHLGQPSQPPCPPPPWHTPPWHPHPSLAPTSSLAPTHNMHSCEFRSP